MFPVADGPVPASGSRHSQRGRSRGRPPSSPRVRVDHSMLAKKQGRAQRCTKHSGIVHRIHGLGWRVLVISRGEESWCPYGASLEQASVLAHTHTTDAYLWCYDILRRVCVLGIFLPLVIVGHSSKTSCLSLLSPPLRVTPDVNLTLDQMCGNIIDCCYASCRLIPSPTSLVCAPSTWNESRGHQLLIIMRKTLLYNMDSTNYSITLPRLFALLHAGGVAASTGSEPRKRDGKRGGL